MSRIFEHRYALSRRRCCDPGARRACRHAAAGPRGARPAHLPHLPVPARRRGGRSGAGRLRHLDPARAGAAGDRLRHAGRSRSRCSGRSRPTAASDDRAEGHRGRPAGARPQRPCRSAGLEPARPYWYRFVAGQGAQPVGPGADLPAAGANVARVRFASARLPALRAGLFTAHRKLAAEPDLDFVFCYGDYIYEYRGERIWNGPAGPSRMSAPCRRRDLQPRRLSPPLRPVQDGRGPAGRPRRRRLVHRPGTITRSTIIGSARSIRTARRPPDLQRCASRSPMQAYYENMPLRARSFPVGPSLQLSAPRRAGRARRFSACTVSGTSWTRRSWTPCSAPFSASASEPASRWSAGASPDKRADHALAAGAEHDRAAEAVEQRQAVQQLEIVLHRLAEADAGIDDDPRAVDARRDRRLDPRLQPVIDFEQHRPVVARRLLHRLGAALMVHQHDRAAGAGDHLGRALVEGQRRDVVDQPAPAASAASITAALRVSIDTAVPARASCSTTGSTRFDLVAFPDRAPGGSIRRRHRRSPRRPRPWRARLAPRRPGSSWPPPSEKLSGVTLTMPTTCG
jgi:hypothetical protein